MEFVLVPELLFKVNVNPLTPLVTLIVPVFTKHVGSVIVAETVPGNALTVIVTAFDVAELSPMVATLLK